MKELKELVILGFDMLDGIEKSAADGKWQPSDALNFSPLVRDLPAAVSGITLIPSELKKASPADWDDLIIWASAEFDLDDDVVEQKVEAALEVVGGFVRGWAKWPKAAS